MKWVFNDGGRLASGFKCMSGDCVTRSIAIATKKPYREVFDKLNLLAENERPKGKKKRSNSNNGVYKKTYKKYIASLGWEWVPTMQIGSGCKVHLKENELPNGILIVEVSKHVTCVIDGVIFDTHDPSRDGKRCVYGYWRSQLTF